jgi:histidinol-phosphate/aromatic aminotransferase/cobyric acid decarboxylase-like protein
MECPVSETNFVFADLGDSDLDLYGELYGYGVIVRRMGQFGSARNTYRISIGTPEENETLLSALRQICSSSKA